jgi:hypothetical protein
MSEGGAAGGCTGGTGCCIPTCDVQVNDSLGGSGVVRWSANCQANFGNPMGTQDVYVTWIPNLLVGHTLTWYTNTQG